MSISGKQIKHSTCKAVIPGSVGQVDESWVLTEPGLESSNNFKGLSGLFLNDKHDLVAPKKTDSHDSLSELLQASPLQTTRAISVASTKSHSRWANIISTLIAAELLVGSILGLCFVAGLKIKFVMIAVFCRLLHPEPGHHHQRQAARGLCGHCGQSGSRWSKWDLEKGQGQ
ncbi:uncharacterized protein PgNI_08496 [Pyricularia grisea]|uniref:DUF6594 domain-containing protein n=1 Tax=Pyricularia grisea TaxID=148305 RepID=A0A6P8AVM4_PYRGI|nr:uncharacterized protein PgNI_08496 [Pyricularia grisea]TLD06250.1 hypothetical protein PgNI_08496 [Pyricularia grisea]